MPRLALLLVLVLAAGCVPCKDACRAEARQFERCLGDWGLEWADVGAIDRADYRETCLADVDVFVDGLPAEERADENAACQDLVDDLRAAQTCDAAWASLQRYGSSPN